MTLHDNEMNRDFQPRTGRAGGPSPGTSLMVLHVNDSTDDQVLFQSACKVANVPINWHVADSTEKALSYLQHTINQSKLHEVCWPDVILLDIHLPPQSEGGFAVLKYIRSQPELHNIPVVIFTGLEFPGLIEEALRLGADSYFIKPLGFEKEVELVQVLYNKWGPKRAPTHPRLSRR